MSRNWDLSHKEWEPLGDGEQRNLEWQVSNLIYVYSVLLAVLGHRTQHLLLVRQASVLLGLGIQGHPPLVV